MWPFKRRRKTEKLLAPSIDRLAGEVAHELLNNPGRLQLKTERVDICFILLQVRDDRADEVLAHMATAIDIILRRNGMVCDVMSSVVLSMFGFPVGNDMDEASDQRAKSIARLLTELGSNIRLVHGTAEGLVGNFGSPQRLHYGPVLPGFARYMTALLALEFGQSAAVPAT